MLQQKVLQPWAGPSGSRIPEVSPEGAGQASWLLQKLCFETFTTARGGVVVRKSVKEGCLGLQLPSEPPDCCCKHCVAVGFTECLCSQLIAQGKDFPFSLIACFGDTYHPGYSSWPRGPV